MTELSSIELFFVAALFGIIVTGLVGAVTGLVEYPPVRHWLDKHFRWFP